ncbi:MAG: purine-nucleoside phosphorylase [Candidatus Marinimicrobia bacterium]|jgi:purine-nucleoside phosphorylase|nr:purine-nucleoside phosphorylase [Candidatus Neomarinimicrobiota bacterium]|tara:strand:- start:962 stop:1747 length:786 start_codon:yes stop_codon:yes gene_type:complete
MNKMREFMLGRLPETPHFAIVLGSGLSSLTNDLMRAQSIPFSDIPNYPETTVSGHKGEFIFGYLDGIPILCARGRFHFYEGLSLSEVTIPIKLFSALQIPNLIITNSAGCVNSQWNLGDIMLINGHLDFTFRDGNPKIDKDKSIYKESNRQIAKSVASQVGLELREGVYTWTLGPTYETPAEINMIREHGGDAVGMSTLPEIVEAGLQKLNMWGFTCFTNMAAGIENEVLSHDDVLSNAEKFKDHFKNYINQLITTISEEN